MTHLASRRRGESTVAFGACSLGYSYFGSGGEPPSLAGGPDPLSLLMQVRTSRTDLPHQRHGSHRTLLVTELAMKHSRCA